MPVMRPARDEEVPRRAYVMKRHYEEHGYAEGCEGCARLSVGMKLRPHSNACREMMYKELKKTEEGRTQKEERRTRKKERRRKKKEERRKRSEARRKKNKER